MSKTPQRRKRRTKTVPREQTKRNKTLYRIGIPTCLIILLLLLTNKDWVINRLIINNSYSLTESDYKVKVIFDIINYNHQLIENQNLKEKILPLLHNEASFYGEKKKKEAIKFRSEYSKFYFAQKPIYDFENEVQRDFEVRFIAVHKYRKPEKAVIKVENTYAKIINGKLLEIQDIPNDESEIKKFSNINNYYRYYCLYSIFISVYLYVILYIFDFVFFLLKDKELANGLLKSLLRFIGIPL